MQSFLFNKNSTFEKKKKLSYCHDPNIPCLLKKETTFEQEGHDGPESLT